MNNLLINRASISIYDESTKQFKKCYILINPSSLEFNLDFDFDEKKETGTKKGIGDTLPENPQLKQNTISMNLIFDIVDGYDLATQEIAGKIGVGIVGLIGGSSTKKELEAQNDQEDIFRKAVSTEIDITNKKYSHYSDILEAARSKKFVVFTWGSTIIPGTIVEFSTNFTYFSRFGNPLRAEVGLTIEKQKMPEDKKTKIATEEEVSSREALVEDDELYVSAEISI